jgi:glutamate N-acetyltransferase / amino-acid N-acetyltransferase
MLNAVVGTTGTVTGGTKMKTGVTAPKGFLAAGAFVGIKKKNGKEKKDLALIFSEVPAHAACVFTTNVVKAACILYNQEIVGKEAPIAQGIVVNSGNANACTGELGMVHTKEMAEAFAQSLGIQANQVLVASTGVIGVPLPIETVKNGIKEMSNSLSSLEKSGNDAAQAIMTTDCFAKEISLEVEIGGKIVTIGGMAKGSGMIHPNMATMLGFITTDANISPALLKQALKESNDKTFNMISVDGDTSTNDMLAILANGLAENPTIDQPGPDYELFVEALESVNRFLAKAIARDGEGATKLLEVIVQGAATVQDAQKLARSVVSSNLTKAAFFGQDANWGRVLCALGYAGVNFDPMKVSIEFFSQAGLISLMHKGEPIKFDEDFALSILKEKEIKVLVTMGEGDAQATAWGCDLSYDYVRINGSYRS